MRLQDAHIHKIGLFVKDYSRSLAFYKSNLGLTSIWESEQAKNAGFLTGHTILIVQADPAQVSAGGARLYFTVANARLMRDELVRAGVACDPARDLGFAIFVEFADPDGNRLALFQPSAEYLPQMEAYLGHKVPL